ncbi:hypothetical protein ACFSC4_29995 [Deinococcus malanensis]|uniref:hypothetical protein n=1 Tax=Deinococcus malanensis TaxID=1706855 RepID=UPI00362F5128
MYAIERLEIGGFDTLGPTAKFSLTVTSHATGEVVTFGPILRRQRRNKTTGEAKVHYSTPVGPFKEWNHMVAALVAAAAQRLSERGVAA